MTVSPADRARLEAQLEQFRDEKTAALRSADKIMDAAQAAKRKITSKEKEELDNLHATVRHLSGEMDRIRDEALGLATPESTLRSIAYSSDNMQGRNAGAPRVTRDGTGYAPDSGRSLFLDMVQSQARGDGEATARLRRAADRSQGIQTRDMAVVAGVGGEFAAPAYLGNLFLENRVSGAPVAFGLAQQHVAPTQGSSAVIPAMLTGTSVATLAQANPLNTAQEGTPTTDDLEFDIVEKAGYVDVSNYVRERGYVPGLDQIIVRDLTKQLAFQCETDIITHLRANGDINAITATATTPSFATDIYPKLLQAFSEISTDSKSEVPDAIVTAPRRVNKWLSERDDNNRPLLGMTGNAQNALGTHGSPTAQGLSTVQIAGVPVVQSQGIALTSGATTSEDSVYVGAWKDGLYVWSSGVNVMLDPYTLSANSGMRIVARMYFGYGVVRAGSLCRITGSALVTPTWT